MPFEGFLVIVVSTLPRTAGMSRSVRGSSHVGTILINVRVSGRCTKGQNASTVRFQRSHDHIPSDFRVFRTGWRQALSWALKLDCLQEFPGLEFAGPNSLFFSLSLSHHWRWNFLNHLFITLSDDKYHNIHLEPAIMSVYSDLKPHWNTTIYMSLSVNFPKGHSGGQQQAQVALERTQKQAWLSHAPCDVVMYSHYAS